MLCEDKKCVGCFACSAVCPVGAIHFCEDNRGFLKPQIDDSVCINCKKCDSVCPALKNVSKQISLNIYAAQNKNQDERMESSSGGLFSVFAQKILEGGGAVLGVSFDKDKKVKHILIEKKEHLEDLRGSKYVQSNLSDCYLELKKWLDSGKKVLFSGTPCQVAAVKKYAGDNCENLITCDLVCHGVPSPKIFGQAIELYEKTYGAKVSACNFRKKFPSWNLFSMEMVFENGKRHLKTKDADPYLKGFLESLFLRESCYNCSYADVKRVSDITLADFWGYIHDNDVIQDNNTGISLVMVNSEKGRSLFEAIKDEIVYVEKTIQEAKKENYCLINSFDKPENYYSFWKDYETKKFDEVCKKYLSVNGKLYLDAKETNAKFDEITVIPSDAVGSKGDEAMLRGMLNLFNGKKIRMLTPRRELWKGWLIDRNEDYTEQYVELEELKNTIKKPTHLVIIGADIMDGLYGSRDTMTRLEAAERVIDLGGRVDIFSCSFRMEVSEDIIRKIINIGERLHFHFRDDQSLNNFKKQTSLEADYFPDLAFLCEKTLSGKSEEVNQQIRVKKAGKKIIFGINFCEHACRGFYNEPSLKQRKEYIASVIDQIDSVLGNQVFYVLIPHDTKYWDGHYSDEEYAKWAMEYIIQKHSSDSVLCVNNYMTETELLSILPELDMIVSGRMHLDIAAIRSGVIPIAYMGNCQTTSYRNIEKFKGMFMERIGHSDLVSGSEEEFTFSLKKAIKDNDGIKTSILERNRIKNADMLELVNQFRSKIGLSQFKKDVDAIHYTQGNMTTTVAYIAELSVNYKRQQEYVKQQRDQIYQINQKAEEEQLVLKTELENKKAHIELLLQSERDLKNELEALRNSRTWRMAFFLHKPVVWCLPEGSKRRLLVKIICKLFRHPVRAFKMLSPRKIRHFLYYLKEEGPGFVAKRIDESMQGISVQSMKLDMVTLDENKPFDEYDKLTFSKTEQPDVSIIIPVYNQFAYTYHCLQSILNHTGTEVTYEVIIANDCSSDETTRLGEIVENVHIITNEQNLRFLKNCNHAAEFANGKYILFLNNDTQAQKDWLAPLVRLMESSQNIGMVGSKLIYANGMLQEAGGIVWKDASAWNYGNRSNPTNPEYNYVKEADYISGAAIMIRSSLWKEIGGFDENFAPAYYEDTDLAFEVRKHGYKVR